MATTNSDRAGERRLHPLSWLFVLIQQLKSFALPLLVLASLAGRAGQLRAATCREQLVDPADPDPRPGRGEVVFDSVSFAHEGRDRGLRRIGEVVENRLVAILDSRVLLAQLNLAVRPLQLRVGGTFALLVQL